MDDARPSPAPGAAAPRLTVLIPGWNAARTIERALASVLEERTVPLECLVIDDGSTDGTADVAEAVAARDPRVVVIRLPENLGVSEARNRGLARSRGAWLTFLDADDQLRPGAITALMAPTADPSVRAVIGQRIWTDGERTWLSNVYDIPDIREPGRKSIATHPGLLYYASMTGKAFDRSLTEGLAFRGRVLGDQPWTIRALLRAGDGIEVIGDTVYEWWRPTGRTEATITAATRASALRAAEAAAMAEQVFAEVSLELETSGYDTASRRAIQAAYFERLVRSDMATMLRALLDAREPAIGRFFEALGHLLKAVPPEVVGASKTLPTGLLRPPYRRWSAVASPARAAYWQLLRTARSVDPTILGRVGPGRLGVRTLSLLVAVDGRFGARAADAVLRAVRLAGRLRPRRPAGRS